MDQFTALFQGIRQVLAWPGEDSAVSNAEEAPIKNVRKNLLLKVSLVN